jgi:DNA repair protein RecO (recombination protein O)
MARRTAESIILRTRPLGEADLVVTFLTPDDGKIEATARAARKSRRRFGGALDPLTFGKAAWTETEGRALAFLESFEIVRSFAQRQSDLPWFYLFAYVAEVADTFAREREPDPRFYRLVRVCAEASAEGSTPDLVRRWFELWTLRLQGLLPGFGECSRCRKPPGGRGLSVEPASGETSCAECAGSGGPREASIALTGEELEWLRRALRSVPGKMPAPPSAPGLGRLVRALLTGFTGKPFRTARFLDADR